MSSFETMVKAFPINGDLQAEVEKLVAAGWQQAPGTEPVAIYHLVRIAAAAALIKPFAEGKMIIDDSKVFVRKASGEIVQ